MTFQISPCHVLDIELHDGQPGPSSGRCRREESEEREGGIEGKGPVASDANTRTRPASVLGWILYFWLNIAGSWFLDQWKLSSSSLSLFGLERVALWQQWPSSKFRRCPCLVCEITWSPAWKPACQAKPGPKVKCHSQHHKPQAPHRPQKSTPPQTAKTSGNSSLLPNLFATTTTTWTASLWEQHQRYKHTFSKPHSHPPKVDFSGGGATIAPWAVHVLHEPIWTNRDNVQQLMRLSVISAFNSYNCAVVVGHAVPDASSRSRRQLLRHR